MFIVVQSIKFLGIATAKILPTGLLGSYLGPNIGRGYHIIPGLWEGIHNTVESDKTKDRNTFICAVRTWHLCTI
jgi:hypothetical protein